MKKFNELKNKASKLHDEIAMQDVNTNEDEGKLDIICEHLCQVIQLLNELDK